MTRVAGHGRRSRHFHWPACTLARRTHGQLDMLEGHVCHRRDVDQPGCVATGDCEAAVGDTVLVSEGLEWESGFTIVPYRRFDSRDP